MRTVVCKDLNMISWIIKGSSEIVDRQEPQALEPNIIVLYMYHQAGKFYVSSSREFICIIRQGNYMYHQAGNWYVSSSREFICINKQGNYMYHQAGNLYVSTSREIICIIKQGIYMYHQAGKLYESSSREFICINKQGNYMYHQAGNLYVSISREIICIIKQGIYMYHQAGNLYVSISREIDEVAYTSVTFIVRIDWRNFRRDWSWTIFYGHSLSSADSRRAVVSFWRKNVHSTG